MVKQCGWNEITAILQGIFWKVFPHKTTFVFLILWFQRYCSLFLRVSWQCVSEAIPRWFINGFMSCYKTCRVVLVVTEIGLLVWKPSYHKLASHVIAYDGMPRVNTIWVMPVTDRCSDCRWEMRLVTAILGSPSGGCIDKLNWLS